MYMLLFFYIFVAPISFNMNIVQNTLKAEDYMYYDKWHIEELVGYYVGCNGHIFSFVVCKRYFFKDPISALKTMCSSVIIHFSSKY